jgi:hypothetical protein
MTQYVVDLGFAPVPDDASEVEPFAASRTWWSMVIGSFSRQSYLIQRTWVPSNNPYPRLVETSWWTRRRSRFRHRSGQ